MSTGGLSELRSKFRFPSCLEGCIAVFCDPRSWFPEGRLNDLVQRLRDEGDIRFTFGCHPHFADHMLGQVYKQYLYFAKNIEPSCHETDSLGNLVSTILKPAGLFWETQSGLAGYSVIGDTKLLDE